MITLPQTLERRKAIFDAARRLPIDERSDYLNQACGSDATLRCEIEQLLEDFCDAGEFLGEPTLGTRALAEAPTVVSGHAERAGARLGRYKLLELIGEGGFGTVYMAEQEQPVRRRVALKIIKLGMDTKQVIARFEAERQALAMMDHPNIARVLDAGTTESGRPYFVMELVKGVPITRYCDDNRLAAHERLALFADVCHAVQHAHQKGIIHRDLKPSNVIVSRYDDRPVVKIIDFGIAKATNATARLTDKTLFTEMRQLIGTPAYMSPEQAGLSDLDVDTRSDIYSLGVLLYELLTGTTPFDARKLRDVGYDEMRRMIREVEPPRPSARVSSLDHFAADAGADSRSGREAPAKADSSAGAIRAATGTNCDSSAALVAERRDADPKSLARLLRGELDWIAMKCLEKDRRRRYDTANGLALDVARYLVGEPVLAGPPDASYRLRKLLWRNRGLFGAAAAIVLALAGGLGVALWQAQRAGQEAERARDQASRADAINSFLHRAFAAADPFEQLLDTVLPTEGLSRVARDRTVVEVLDQAARSLDEDDEFRDQPLTDAALRFSIGRVYAALGRIDAAEKQLRRAYAIQRVRLGPQHRDTLATLVELVKNARSAPDHEALLTFALDAVPRVFGREDRMTLALMQANAAALAAAYREDKAIDVLHEVLEIQRRTLPKGDLQTMETMYHLTFALRAVERYSEARELARQSVELAIHTHGEDDPITHMARKQLIAAVERNYTAQDLEMIQTAAEGLSRHLGPEHVQALNARDRLGDVLLDLGRYDEAEQVLNELLADRARQAGEDSAEAWYTRGLLCEVMWRSGRWDEAERCAKRYLENLQTAPDGRFPLEPVKPMETLFDVYTHQGRMSEAVAVAREALALASALPQQGDYGRVAKDWRDDLVYALTESGQIDEAIDVALEQVEILRETRPDMHPSTLRALNGLAWALYVNEQYEEAEPLAREAATGYRRVARPDNLDRVNATDTLAMVLLKLNRPAEAEPLLREIVETHAQGPLKDMLASDAGMHELHHGECLLVLERYTEAEARLLTALQKAGEAPGCVAPQTVESARARLVELYEKVGSPEKADPYRGMIGESGP